MQEFNSSRFQERNSRQKKPKGSGNNERYANIGSPRGRKVEDPRYTDSPEPENEYPEVDIDDGWDYVGDEPGDFREPGDVTNTNEFDASEYRDQPRYPSAKPRTKSQKEKLSTGVHRNGHAEPPYINMPSRHKDPRNVRDYSRGSQVQYPQEYPEVPENDSQLDDAIEYSESGHPRKMLPSGQDQRSLSEYGTRSVAESNTPRELGGESQTFWHPELNPDTEVPKTVPSAVAPQPTRLQKFMASFRRPKSLRQHSEDKLAQIPPTNSSALASTASANVVMLDGIEISFSLDRNDIGQALFTQVCRNADLIEVDYFGLTYVDSKLRTWFWLDLGKKISKQLRHDEQWMFSFQVKFYPPEPNLLQEDITRYQLTLQVRQDIYTGKLPCSWVTQALLGSFMVQAELGDFDADEHGHSTDYLRELEFVPSPTPQLLHKIAELHKTHVGMKPNQADMKYLETAKRLELYGVDLHPVRDTENVEIYLGVGFHGVVIYRDRLRIGRFAWPKVLRISYKKNNFYLKIRPDNTEPVESVVGFRLFNHYLAKRLWQVAVDNHTFFRLKEAASPKTSGVIGDKYGYTGHTFFQYRTMNIRRDAPSFDRSLAKRQTASMPMGLNQSVSMHTLNRAHPRDMTIGRKQQQQQTPRTSSVGKAHASSTGHLYSSLPRDSTLANRENRSETGGGRPPSDSVLAPSDLSRRQRHDSQAPSGSRHVQYQPGGGDSDSAVNSELNRLDWQDPNRLIRSDRDSRAQQARIAPSPIYANANQRPSDGDLQSTMSSNFSHQSTDLRANRRDLYNALEPGSNPLPRRKPPMGGVPVLGGIMLPSMRGGSQRSGRSSGKPTEKQAPVDSLEDYDDDHGDDLGSVEGDRRYSSSRNHVPSSGRPSNPHNSRRQEPTELML